MSALIQQMFNDHFHNKAKKMTQSSDDLWAAKALEQPTNPYVVIVSYKPFDVDAFANIGVKAVNVTSHVSTTMYLSIKRVSHVVVMCDDNEISALAKSLCSIDYTKKYRPGVILCGDTKTTGDIAKILGDKFLTIQTTKEELLERFINFLEKGK